MLILQQRYEQTVEVCMCVFVCEQAARLLNG